MNKSKHFPINTGVPQGSILGPPLLIHVYTIAVFNPSPFYTDDIILYFTSSHTIITFLSSMLSVINVFQICIPVVK